MNHAPDPAITYTVADKTWSVQIGVTPPVYLLELARKHLELLQAEGHENLVIIQHQTLLEEDIEEPRQEFDADVRAERATLALPAEKLIPWCRYQIETAQRRTAAWAAEHGVRMVRRAAS